MTTATADQPTTLDPTVWADLLGVPYRPWGRTRAGMDCYGLVLEIQRRLGRPVPDVGLDYDPLAPATGMVEGAAAGAWERVQDPAPGDMVLFWVLAARGGWPDHAGVLIEPRKFLHLLAGRARACLSPLDRFADRVAGFYRPRAGNRVALPALPAVDSRMGVQPSGAGDAPGGSQGHLVRTVFVPDPIGQTDRAVCVTTWREGSTVWDYVPVDRLTPEAQDRLLVRVNGGRRLTAAEAAAEPCPAGAEVFCWLPPGIPVPAALVTATGISAATLAAIGNIVIATTVGLLAQLITAPGKPKLDQTEDNGSPTFNLAGTTNTTANGTTVPVVYGRIRTGGQILQLFFETDDQFRSTLYMLVCVSEGEVKSIGGITADTNRASAASIAGTDIEIDGNPIGSLPQAKVSVRLGKTRQSPIPGFDRTVVAFDQNTLLRATSPLVAGTPTVPNNDQTFLYTTTQPVDGFALLIQYPIGLYDVTSGGNESTYIVAYTLRYRRKGIPSSEVVEVVNHGPSLKKSDHTRAIRKYSLTRDIYEIRITRMTDNDENLQRKFSVSKLIAVNEYVSDDPVAYNGKALLAIEAVHTGQLSGSIPDVTSIVEGKLCHVWNGVSTTSPAFTFQWTDNPAWIILDILTNPTYGMGALVGLQEIDLASFRAFADYCEVNLTTSGQTHKRWQFNHVFAEAQRAWDAIGLVAAAARATVVLSGSKYKVVIEQATNPTQLFSMGNIVPATMKLRYLPSFRRPNLVRLQYRNAALDWDSDVAPLESGVTGSTRFVQETMSLLGITNARQAYRACKYVLNVAQAVKRALTFKAPIDAVAVEPGDTFNFEHDALALVVAGGRVAVDSGSSESITFDRDITVPASPAYEVMVRTYDPGSGQELLQVALLPNGTFPAGSEITLSSSWTVPPKQGDVYAVGPKTTYLTTWRAVSVRRLADQNVEIDALQYATSVYTDDPGTIEGFTDIWPDTRKFPAAVSGLRVVEVTLVLQDGSVHHAIDVSFAPVKEGEHHDVWVRPVSDTDQVDGLVEWWHAGLAVDGQFRVQEGIAPRTAYMVSVTPLSASGNRLDPTYGTTAIVSILGRLEFPEAPTGLAATNAPRGGLFLTWTPSVDLDVDHYEVRETLTEPRKFLFSQVLAKCACGSGILVEPHRIGAAHYFQIAAVNRSGFRSITPAYVQGTPAAMELSQLVSTSEAASWTGVKTSMTVAGSVVRSDLGATAPSYRTTNIALASKVGLVRIFVEAAGYEIDWTIEEAGYPINSPHARRKRIDGLLLENPEPPYILALDDNDYPIGAPGCYLQQLDGPVPMDTVYAMRVQYEVSTDSGGSWQPIRDYTGPFPVEAGATHVRVTVSFGIPANCKLRAQIEEITVQQHAPMLAGAVYASDKNSHFSNTADTVDSHLEELGYLLNEQVRDGIWDRVFNSPRWWNQSEAFYSAGVAFARAAPDAADTTIAHKLYKIPKWYQKDGSNVITVDVWWFGSTVPGADQIWRLRVRHGSMDASEVVPGGTNTDFSITVASATHLVNRLYKSTVNVTTPDFGTGDELALLALYRRASSDAVDTYAGTVYIAGIAIRSGVKNT